MNSLHVRLPGPMFLLGGSLGALCPGVSVQGGGLCPGRGSLSREGVSVQGGGLYLWDLCQGDPQYSEEWVVRILLEWFLVLHKSVYLVNLQSILKLTQTSFLSNSQIIYDQLLDIATHLILRSFSYFLKILEYLS